MSSEDVDSFCLGLYRALTKRGRGFFSFFCIYCDSYNEQAAFFFGLCRN